MNNLLLTVLCLLIVAAVGLVLAAVKLSSRRVSNPQSHPAADEEYTMVYVNGEPHAFTDEALAVARARALKLRIE